MKFSIFAYFFGDTLRLDTNTKPLRTNTNITHCVQSWVKLLNVEFSIFFFDVSFHVVSQSVIHGRKKKKTLEKQST